MTLTKPAVIGITGGVGAGKSSVLEVLRKKTDCRMIIADEAAKKMQEKGQACYNDIVAVLGKDVLLEDGSIDKVKMAALIYGDEALRKRVNGIIHPAVNRYIKDIIRDEKEEGIREFLFIEAALLIECGYDKICDELWYVYAPEDVRRARLKESRGYSDEKTASIMKSQLKDEEFRKNCREIIDNGRGTDELITELDRLLNRKRREFFGEG